MVALDVSITVHAMPWIGDISLRFLTTQDLANQKALFSIDP